MQKKKLPLSEQKMTSLRKYILMTGRDPFKLSTKKIDKIANTSAYKQFRLLRKLLRTQKKSEQLKRKLQKETVELLEYKRSTINVKNIPKVKSSLHDYEWHKSQIHSKMGRRAKNLRKRVKKYASLTPVVIYHSPGQSALKSKGKRGYMASGKGITIVINKAGRSKTMRESKEPQETKVLDKLKSILVKNKEVKLNKGKNSVILNPECCPPNNDQGYCNRQES